MVIRAEMDKTISGLEITKLIACVEEELIPWRIREKNTFLPKYALAINAIGKKLFQKNHIFFLNLHIFYLDQFNSSQSFVGMLIDY